MYRIVESEGKFQPQRYTYADTKWYQRIRMEWKAIVLNDIFWYSTYNEAKKVIDDRINPPDRKIKYYNYNAYPNT